MAPLVELNTQEDVLGLVRRHVLVEAPRFLFGTLWVFSPFFFFFPLLSLGVIGLGLFAFLEVTGWFHLVKRFVIWRKTVLLVTSDRVVDVDQVGMRRRQIESLGYNEIHAVHVRQGWFARLCGYGSLRVESRGSHQFDIEMTGISQPDRVRDLIVDVQCLERNPDAHVKT